MRRGSAANMGYSGQNPAEPVAARMDSDPFLLRHDAEGHPDGDLQAALGQGLDLALAPFDECDRLLHGGLQVEGVDLLQGEDAVCLS